MRAARRRRLARPGLEWNVAHPERDGRLRDAQCCRDVLEGSALGAHEACLFLEFDFAAVAHVGRVYRTGVRIARALRLFEIIAEALRARRVAELREGLRLDLANALARDAELLADFFERADLSVVETEAQSHHRAFTIVELLQRFLDRLREQRAPRPWPARSRWDLRRSHRADCRPLRLPESRATRALARCVGCLAPCRA